jgi:hypothetical protein
MVSRPPHPHPTADTSLPVVLHFRTAPSLSILNSRFSRGLLATGQEVAARLSAPAACRVLHWPALLALCDGWGRAAVWCRYVDVILQLVEKAGDFVSDDIWYRVVQIVTNNDDLQVSPRPLTPRIPPAAAMLASSAIVPPCPAWPVLLADWCCVWPVQAYAASKVLAYIRAAAVHETMLKVAAYLLGEYGHLLARQPASSPRDIFAALHHKFQTARSAPPRPTPALARCCAQGSRAASS